MSYKSFYDFYYSMEDTICDLADVQDEYERNSGNISRYKGCMFCPECKEAELRFTHKTSLKRAFLSKIPTSSHKEGCSYIHDYVTTKELQEFVTSLSGHQIEDRLEAVLNSLFSEPKQTIKETNNQGGRNPFVIQQVNKTTNTIKRKTIPRKSINSWFDKEEENHTYIFYGRVKLQVDEIHSKENNKVFYKLIVKTKTNKGTWVRKTSIFRSYKKDEVDIDAVYDLAVLGHIKFFKNKPQITTETWASIKFRKTSSK